MFLNEGYSLILGLMTMSCEDVFGMEGNCRDADCVRVEYKPATKKVFVGHFFLLFRSLYFGIPNVVNLLAIVLVFCSLHPLLAASSDLPCPHRTTALLLSARIFKSTPATYFLHIEQSCTNQDTQFYMTLCDNVNTFGPNYSFPQNRQPHRSLSFVVSKAMQCSFIFAFARDCY